MNEKDVKDYFDSNPNTYKSHSIHDGWVEKKHFIQENYSGGRFLDIGCGSGRFLNYAFQDMAEENLYGIDISAEMLPDEPTLNEQYLLGSATAPPLRTEQFEMIHMENVLHHIVGNSRTESKKMARKTIDKCLSLLQPGGYFLLSELFYEGPVYPPLPSYIIFNVLKHMPNLSSIVDPEAIPGLSVSFFTRSELVDVIDNSSADLLDAQIQYWEAQTLLRKVLIKDYGQIHLFIHK